MLKEEGVELAKGTLEKLYDDNFNIYKAFSTAEESVFLSYASSDLEGKSLRSSIIVNRIKKIFPKLKEESDVIERKDEIITQESVFEKLLENLREYRDGKEINEIWFSIFNYYNESTEWKDKLENSLKALNYSIQTEKIEEKNLDKLYGNTLRTSVSRLEQYESCPFSYFLKYGLNLSEREEFKIQSLDTGTFMHDVIDTFFDKLQENGLKVKNAKSYILTEKGMEELLKMKGMYKDE